MTLTDLDASLERIAALEELQPVPASEISYDAPFAWADAQSALHEAWQGFWQGVSAYATVESEGVRTRVGCTGNTVAWCHAGLTNDGVSDHLARLTREMEVKARLLAVGLCTARTAAVLATAAHAPTVMTVMSAVRNSHQLAMELKALSALYGAATGKG